MSIASLSASASSATGLNGQSRTELSNNFDTFLKLLTAQLANQDPMDPLDSNKFTEQLVAYSQVEQQIRTNEEIGTLIKETRATAGASAVGYLGKRAVIESDLSTLTADGARWTYSFDKPSERVRLSVRDTTGREVFGADGQAGQGEKSFAWNGLDQRGKPVPAGAYRLVTQAVDANNNSIRAKIATEETIIGVGFNADGLTFRTGSGEKPFAQVRSVRD